MPTPQEGAEEERQLLPDRCQLLSWTWSHRRPGHCQVEKVNVEKERIALGNNDMVWPMAGQLRFLGSLLPRLVPDQQELPATPLPQLLSKREQALSCQSQGPTFHLMFPLF